MADLRDELELRRKTEIHEVEEVCHTPPYTPLSPEYTSSLPPSPSLSLPLPLFFSPSPFPSLSLSLSLPPTLQRKNGQINTLMKNHEKAFSDIKNYYNDITLNNLALINSLKVECAMGTTLQ